MNPQLMFRLVIQFELSHRAQQQWCDIAPVYYELQKEEMKLSHVCFGAEL